MLRRQHKAISEVRINSEQAREHSAVARQQVQNSHTTNLRDDIDDLKAGIQSVLDMQLIHTDAIVTLRQDLTWERRERIDVAARLSRIEGLM